MRARESVQDPQGRAVRGSAWKARPAAQPAPADGAGDFALADLQRGPGNAAVARMLQRSGDGRTGERRPSGPAPAVQRRIVEFEADGARDAAERGLFRGFLAAVDEAVGWAHGYVTTCPQLGLLADHDGHTGRWAEVWREFNATGRSGGIAKEFGYAVESLADVRLAGHPLPAGVSVGRQVPYGATRPDYVLYAAGEVVGAVDITAAGSTGHVLGKAAWATHFRQFGEAVYPSLTPETTTAMRLAHGNTGPLSEQEAGELAARAAQRRDAERQMWSAMAASFTRAMQLQGIVGPDGRVLAGGDPVVVEARRRDAVVRWMTHDLGVGEADAERNAASMLLTFSPSWPGSFSFWTSTASASRGEAFLTSVFPHWADLHGPPAQGGAPGGPGPAVP